MPDNLLPALFCSGFGKDYIPPGSGKGKSNPKMPEFKRLTKDSEAYKLLEQMFKEGDVEPSAKPKAIYDSEEVFQDHKPESFRALFNKFKGIHGLYMRNDDGKPGVADGIAKAQKKAVGMMDDLMVAKELGPPKGQCGFVTPAAVKINDSRRLEVDWTPHNVQTEIDDHEFTKKIYVVVAQLPSGIGKDDEIELELVNDCSELQVKCLQHPTMMNAKALSVVYSNFVEPEQRLIREKALGLSLRRMLNNERKDIWGVWRTPLPFKVEDLFRVNQVAIVHGCTYLYLELQAAEVITFATNRKSKSAVDYSDQI